MGYHYSFNKVWDKIARVCGACALFGISFGYAVAGMGWWWFVITLSVLVISGWLIIRWAQDSVNHIRGMQGELRVDTMLTTLPKDLYWHENDVMLLGDKWNIDHVVIGPNGIWTIETKNHKGDVWVQGGKLMRGKHEFPGKEIKQALNQAAGLQAHLSQKGCDVPWVQAMIVSANKDAKVNVREICDHVRLVGYQDVANAIKGARSGKVFQEAERAKMRMVLQELRDEMESMENIKESKEDAIATMLFILGVVLVVLGTQINR